MRKKKYIFAISSILLLLSGYFFLPLWGSSLSIQFTIPKGSNTKTIAHILKEKKIFFYPNLFILTARIFNKSKRIHSGDYELNNKISTWQLLRMLEEGKGKILKITIQEGLRAEEIFAKLKASELDNNKNYKVYFRNKAFLRKNKLPPEAKTLEGFLFPETYHFSRFATEKQVLQKMIATFFEKIPKEFQNNFSTDLSFYQLLILASIVEKETSFKPEQKKIASVFYNRLKKDIKLQTDPTVIYGIKNFDGNLTRKHLKTPNPYNSYLNKGLPPSPISNPGLDSINAALYPEKTKYLYFTGKGDGTSYFSTNLKEHNRAVEKYQRSGRKKDYRSH